jgi:hypothetical protein
MRAMCPPFRNPEQNRFNRIYRAKTAKAQRKKLLISPNLACFASLRESSFSRFGIKKTTQISNMFG